MPAVLTHLGELLTSLRATLPSVPVETRSSKLLAQVVLAFVTSDWHDDYVWFRKRLLAFCLREAVSPEQVAEVVQNQPDDWFTSGPDLATAMWNDWSLRSLCLAHQLFWA